MPTWFRGNAITHRSVTAISKPVPMCKPALITLYPHIIREIRARIEPALDDGRFARKKRCYARANNAGWRIDYFLVSERIRGCIEESSILPEVMDSDHCPVMLEMGMPE